MATKKPKKFFVAIGQKAGEKPEALNTFDLVSAAAACAAEFVANNQHPAAGWVETVEVRGDVPIPCRIVEVIAEMPKQKTPVPDAEEAAEAA